MKAKLLSILIIMVLMTSASVFAQGPWGNRGADSDCACYEEGEYLGDYPIEDLSSSETEGLLLMREEEKVARDVYLSLYDKWGLPVFKNISSSEEQHMASIKALLDRYSIEDPVVNDAKGQFTNPEFTKLYNDLVAKGSQSIEEALKVGATIEDLDIADLMKLSKESDNKDIQFVYENLIKASENHLRAFTRQLARYGESYTPQYISQEEYDVILSQDFRRGNRGNGRGRGRGRGRWNKDTENEQGSWGRQKNYQNNSQLYQNS